MDEGQVIKKIMESFPFRKNEGMSRSSYLDNTVVYTSEEGPSFKITVEAFDPPTPAIRHRIADMRKSDFLRDDHQQEMI